MAGKKDKIQIGDDGEDVGGGLGKDLIEDTRKIQVDLLDISKYDGGNTIKTGEVNDIHKFTSSVLQGFGTTHLDTYFDEKYQGLIKGWKETNIIDDKELMGTVQLFGKVCERYNIGHYLSKIYHLMIQEKDSIDTSGKDLGEKYIEDLINTIQQRDKSNKLTFLIDDLQEEILDSEGEVDGNLVAHVLRNNLGKVRTILDEMEDSDLDSDLLSAIWILSKQNSEETALTNDNEKKRFDNFKALFSDDNELQDLSSLTGEDYAALGDLMDQKTFTILEVLLKDYYGLDISEIKERSEEKGVDWINYFTAHDIT